MNLHGKVVLLRAVEPEDVEMLRVLANDPDYEKMIAGWNLPLSKKDQMEWYQSIKNSTELIRLTIVTDKDGAVGMIGLRDFDWKNGSANGLGMRIAKTEIRTKGLATDAWMTLLKYAFEELRLNRINGSALVYNKASLRVCEKVGFKIEGIKRQAEYKNGQYHDLVIMGVLREDYFKLVEESGYWNEK